jgi:hypothetical protein
MTCWYKSPRTDAAIGKLEARGVLKAIRHEYCDACDPE